MSKGNRPRPTILKHMQEGSYNMTNIATAPTTVESVITFSLYSNASGKDYYEIVKNGIGSLSFVEVPEGASQDAVTAAYAAGNIV